MVAHRRMAKILTVEAITFFCTLLMEPPLAQYPKEALRKVNGVLRGERKERIYHGGEVHADAQ